MRDIGKNIKTLRTGQRLTQDDLAERLHVSRQTVSNYETGRSRPDVDMLLSIAAALDTDLQVLLYGPPSAAGRRRQARRLVIALAGLLALGAVWGGVRWSQAVSAERFLLSPWLTPWCAYLAPCFFALAGWTVLQAAHLSLGARPPSLRHARLLRNLLLGGLAVYVLLLLPLVADSLQSALEVARRYARSDGFSYSHTFKFVPVWDMAAMRLFRWAARFPHLFAAVGAALWLTAPPPAPDEAPSA